MELLEFTEAANAYSQLANLEPDNRAWSECHTKAIALSDSSPYDVRRGRIPRLSSRVTHTCAHPGLVGVAYLICSSYKL